MSVQSDRSLAELWPHYRGDIGPASIDLHLGDTLLYWPDWVLRDPRTDQSALWKRADLLCIGDGSAWRLKPGLRYLATTREHITIPPDMAGQIGARSSWGRDGLAVIQGPAGWIDPGYSGRPTLELSVVGSELVLWPGAAICQLIVFALDRPCARPYDGKYQGDQGATPSRAHLDGRAS